MNAIIYRIPREINIAYPRSSCTICNKMIYWYENIPVLSYLLLRGKCSGCKTSISIRYPLTEIFIGLISVILAPRSLDINALWNYIFLFSVFCAFYVHFVIDIEHQILPDGINIFLALLFLCSSIMTRHWSYYVVGGLIGFGLTYGVTWLFYIIKGKIGLGGGDIKLFGVLGILLGPVGITHNLFLSCFLGSIVGVTLIAIGKMGRNSKLAFGPYILVTAVFQIYFSEYYDALVRYLF